MGYGTIWRMGRANEARLWWEQRFPAGRPEVYLKFVTDLELQFLRAAIAFPSLGTAEIVRQVKVDETAFPKVSDPEWQAWYENMESSPPPVHRVLDDFLDELRAIKDQAAIAQEWHARWDQDNLRTLDHAVYCLKEIVSFAKATRKKKMGALSRIAGL
jgi:hypothetical protein